MRSHLGVLAALCLASGAGAQSATREWRPEDRTIIGDYSRVNALATSVDRVYIASPAGILIWNPQFKRWEGAFDPPDRNLLSRVFTSLADPIDHSLWLARADGWIHYQPDIQLWDQGVAPEGIITIAFDQDDPAAGLFLRGRRGWQLLPRGGAVPLPGRAPRRPLTPASVQEAIRSNPSLQANAAAILTDNRLRNVRYTAAARSFDNRGWYLGTSGIGTLYLDDGAALPERLAFGLPSEDVGAVFSWPGGIYAATNRTALSDAAFTFVQPALEEFETLPGPPAIGTPFNQVRELAGQGKALWAATDLGLARVEPEEGRMRLADQGSGLPDSRVYSVASRGGRITAGTARGLVRVSDSMVVERLAPGYAGAVYTVFPSGDSVWVGTPSGLLLAVPGRPDLLRAAGLASPRLQAPVVDIATLGDTLVALTQDGFLWREPRSGRWTLGPSQGALLGRLRRFVADGPGFWIAGDRGVGYAGLSTPALRPLRQGDLPGEVNDLALDDQFLWVATSRGLARFRLEAIRP